MELDASKYAWAISSSSECGKSSGETKPVPHIRRTNNIELWWWAVPNRSSTRRLSIRECEQYVQAKKKEWEKEVQVEVLQNCVFCRQCWAETLLEPASSSLVLMCQQQQACREVVYEPCWKHVHVCAKSLPYGLLSSPVISLKIGS